MPEFERRTNENKFYLVDLLRLNTNSIIFVTFSLICALIHINVTIMDILCYHTLRAVESTVFFNTEPD